MKNLKVVLEYGDRFVSYSVPEVLKPSFLKYVGSGMKLNDYSIAYNFMDQHGRIKKLRTEYKPKYEKYRNLISKNDEVIIPLN